MEYFKNINIKELFDTESTYGREYTFPPFSDEVLVETEKVIGYKIPASYLNLLRVQNGGVISCEKFENSWLSVIYGIAPTIDAFNGLGEMYDNWRNEWEYPDIGIPFGETESAGHDMYYMDFRVVDENGEPRIVRVDNENDNRVYFVAKNLEEFLTAVYNNQELTEELID